MNFTEAGILAGVLSFSSSVLQPSWGYLSDRFHSRLFTALAPAVAGIFISSLGWAPNYGMLLAMVFLGGAGIASFHPHAASNATHGITRKRARAMAEPGREYIAFDFWNQNLLGTFRDSLQLDVSPHDTRVLLIRPLLHHPQVIGISRHISGAYSINELSWDPAAKRLKGTSETVPGEPYTLFVHVPEGYKQIRVRASSGIPAAEDGSAPGMLAVTFEGQSEPVKWQIDFGN
jgi:hypothetical protein